jgi:hypothetical protein
MTDWAYLDGDSLVIDWSQVFDNAMNYDAGDKSYDSTLAKLLTLLQRYSFEKGFEEGLNHEAATSKLLAKTGGNA